MTKRERNELAEFTLGFILHELGSENADTEEAQEIVSSMHKRIDRIVNEIPEEAQEWRLLTWLRQLFR